MSLSTRFSAISPCTSHFATRRAAIAALACALISLPAKAAAGTERAFTSSRLSVTTRGSRAKGGRDIVLIPGLASGPAIWQGLTARLQDHRWHLVHIAGFAGMAAGANGNGPILTPIADEIARYIAARGLSAPAIVGHSMGASLAMLLALRAPTAAGRLMVVDMLPEGAAMLGGTADGLGYLAEQLNGYLTGTKAGRQILTDLIRQNPAARDSDPHVIAQSLTELAQLDLGPRLAQIRCPLTVVHAEPSDPQTRAALDRDFRAAYAPVRQARVTGIGPSGHMVMLDQPAKFAEAVQIFLR